MIVAMSRVRVLGPRERLGEVLDVLQDLGLVHLAPPSTGAGLAPAELTPRQERERRHLRRALEDLDPTLTYLHPTASRAASAPAEPADFVRWARLARRLRRRTAALQARGAELAEERALLLKYRSFFDAFQSLLAGHHDWSQTTALSVLLRSRNEESLERLREALAVVTDGAFELRSRPLPSGDLALLILLPTGVAERVDRTLAEAGVKPIPVPAAYGGSLAEALPGMVERLRAIPRELEDLDRERDRLAGIHAPELLKARAAIHDRLRELEALPLSALTAYAFVLEGWVPSELVDRLQRRLQRRLRAELGETVVAREVAREEWSAEEAPVALSNPRLFRPFEALVRMLPLPRYGSIDPTPFVAVFFPMLFGLILGDVGYGALMAALGIVLHHRSKPGTTLRSASEIAGACAAFTIVFGFLYGELFGDLGRRALGLRPLLIDREEAIVPFLGLAIALGLVHILLGLSLGVIAARRHDPRHRREALGRGVTAIMLLLIVAALLTATDVLPRRFFTPAAVLLLVLFPVLIAAEGIIAPIELLATLGNVLSYARVMALGTASVMLAVVANRMVGAMGSAVVGVLLALLFHLVNFALGLFSPAIHALRLHYVEFFGKFYSPGGVEYRPFGHWKEA
ncbi:MAG TPA: V-type ATPase 116kDa subunit family protein [Thermoanaerobaculia bacterium]|nr:V-type ATPase 116kDa subunit family protein [Thermoanaerobaculia bacterium]